MVSEDAVHEDISTSSDSDFSTVDYRQNFSSVGNVKYTQPQVDVVETEAESTVASISQEEEQNPESADFQEVPEEPKRRQIARSINPARIIR